LQKDYDVSAEVIDARSLVPFDYDVVLKSVKKTHRIPSSPRRRSAAASP
jgi:2-oxoisovalerate dehydrogenase E1 component